ncbi:MAG: PKD domain-containing protein [Flavobacteriales bacterium]|nr:PKD domain-containing protein [Flavobacteriales bacterium]
MIHPEHTLCASPTGMVFSWDNYPGALSYELQIATQPDFIGATTFTTNNSFYTPNLSSGQVYYWRVRAITSGGPTPWSFPRTFYAYTPNSFPGCLFWGSAQDLNLPNNTGVATWPTLSGSGYDLFQNVPANRPVYLAQGGFRNWPRIFFPGNQEYFTSNITPAQIENSDPLFIFQFGKCYNQSLGFLYYLGNASALPPAYTCRCAVTEQNDGRYRALAYDGAQSAFTYDFYTTNSQYALITVADVPSTSPGGPAKIFKNGHLQNSSLSVPVPVHPTATFRLGADQNGNLTGHFEVQEFILFNEALSDTQRKIVEKFILDKYAPPVNLGPDVVANGICANVTLQAGDFYSSYLWNTGDTTPSIVATNLGTYWVQVVDPFGRVSADTIRVLPPFNFQQLSDGHLCSGSAIVWDPNVPPGYNLLWSNGSTGNTLTITQPGSYYLTVTDAFNCSFTSDTVTLVLDSFPDADLGASSQTLCAGNFLAFNMPAGQGAQFLWSDGSSDTLLVVNTSGLYWAIATNQNGCVASDTVQVTVAGVAPLVDFATSTRCAGDTIQFSAIVDQPVSNYQWQFGGGVTASGSQAIHLFPTPGPKWVTLKVLGQSGCLGQKTKVLNILAQPTPAFNYSTDPCIFDTTFFFDQSSMPGGNVVQWEWHFGDPSSGAQNHSNDQNPFHIFTSAGIYQVTLRAFNDSLCSKTITVPVFVLPAAIPEFIYDRTCIGEPVQFTSQVTLPPGVALLGYQWNLGNGNTSALPHPQQVYPAGTYTVSLRVNSITQNKVCKAFRVKTLEINKDVLPGFALPDSVCVGVSLTLSDTGSVINDGVGWRLWRISDIGQITGQNVSYAFPEGATGWRTIRLVVQSAGGCRDSVQHTVFVKDAPHTSFTAIPPGGPVPLQVDFINQSSGAHQYLWFLNGVLFHQGDQPSQLTIQDGGNYIVSLVGQSPNGCTDTARVLLIADPPGIGLVLSNVDCQLNGDFLQFQATLLNGGSTEVTSVELLLTAGHQAVATYLWTGSLQSGSQVNIPLPLTLHQPGEAPYCCVKVIQYNGSIIPAEDADEHCKPLENNFWVGQVFPNPSGEEATGLYVHIPAEESLYMNVQDLGGKILWSEVFENLSSGLHFLYLPEISLNSGVYLVTLRYRDKKECRRWIVWER